MTDNKSKGPRHNIGLIGNVAADLAKLATGKEPSDAAAARVQEKMTKLWMNWDAEERLRLTDPHVMAVAAMYGTSSACGTVLLSLPPGARKQMAARLRKELLVVFDYMTKIALAHGETGGKA